jgi:hypothetical protein
MKNSKKNLSFVDGLMINSNSGGADEAGAETSSIEGGGLDMKRADVLGFDMHHTTNSMNEEEI